jgi:hypothetical protein
MNSHYHIVREISGCWIQKPNGGELYNDPHEIVEELNRLQERIKRLEETGDEIVINYVNSLSAFELWRKAKEDLQ